MTRDGQVQNIETGNWLKGEVNNSGYRRVMFKKKRYFVHRLVAETYIPNPDKLPQVNHKDGNKLNNHVNNLEWCDGCENQQHRYYVLEKDLGSKNSNSKLTEEDVKLIRERPFSGREMARMFGVSQTLVRRVLNNECWKHVS